LKLADFLDSLWKSDEYFRTEYWQAIGQRVDEYQQRMQIVF